MSKKKKILYFVFAFIAIFISIGSVHAENYTIGALKPYDANNGDPDPVFDKYTYDFVNPKGEDKTRHLRTEVYYAKPASNNKVIQGYCIEELVAISKIYVSNGNGSSNLTNEQKQLVFQVLSNANNIVGNQQLTLDQLKTKVDGLRGKTADRAKILGTQELVWEITRGERTGKAPFNTYKPNNCSKGCPFYNLLYTRTSDNNLNLVRAEYERLINATRYTFYQAPPGGFSLGGTPTVKNMSYDGTQFIYKVTDANRSFKYFTASATNNVKATISSDGSTLTLTSKEALTGNAKVTLKNKSTNATNTLVFEHNELQDVVSGSASITYTLNLSTPEYQLKIIKKPSIGNRPMKGATFSICTDKAATSNCFATVEIGADGTATYNKIQKPGTYYIREKKAPAGFELDTRVYQVNVTTSHQAGNASNSYATVTVTNKNKEFDLTKKTVDENGNVTKLNDGCGTDTYTGPEFEIKDNNGNNLYFRELSPGKYDVADKSTAGAVSKLKTCNGEFKVYTLTECNYTISETKAPEGLTLPSQPTKDINVCGADKNVSFTNGFAGLEFQKKDEDGNFVNGGKFSLQRKINNVYTDVLLKETEPGTYVYDANLKETDEGATYIMLTKDGIAMISKLPPGEYRISEKEAPSGYEVIKDKDSKALVTIKDSDKDGYYLVEMIDQKATKNGSKSFAELIVTIITGRKVPNYLIIIASLAILLVLAIIVRKRMKK